MTVQEHVVGDEDDGAALGSSHHAHARDGTLFQVEGLAPQALRARGEIGIGGKVDDFVRECDVGTDNLEDLAAHLGQTDARHLVATHDPVESPPPGFEVHVCAEVAVTGRGIHPGIGLEQVGDVDVALSFRERHISTYVWRPQTQLLRNLTPEPA